MRQRLYTVLSEMMGGVESGRECEAVHRAGMHGSTGTGRTDFFKLIISINFIGRAKPGG